MPVGLSDTGFEAKTLETILAELEADVRTTIGAGVDTAPDSPTGQMLAIFASKVREVWELAQAVYASQYPASASGFSLTNVSAITGTKRKAATKSKVLANVNVDMGTYAIGTLVAHVLGQPTRRFSNSVEVVNAGPGAATINGVLFEAEETGPVVANAGTLTVIAAAVAGWNSITNPLDATKGTTVEVDTPLRTRRESELATKGSTTVNAIRADVSALEGVLGVQVLENDTDTTDGNGLPPHSVEVIVQGGDNTEIAKAIFNAVAAGITTYADPAGDDQTVVVQDSANENHTVKFSRPTLVPIYLIATLTAEADTWVGDDFVKAVLVDFAAANYRVGSDVITSRLVAELWNKVPGLVTIASVNAGTAPGPVSDADIVITARQLPTVATINQVVVETLV